MRRSRLVIGVVCVVMLTVSMAPTPWSYADAAAAHCRDVNFPVVVEGTTYALHATACLPPGWQARPLQVLLSGASYANGYWDFAVDPGRYSYVRAANAAGYATLAVDRLGVGQSGRPPSRS